MNEFYQLDPRHTDERRVKKERQKARDLRATHWWKNKTTKGECEYCGKKVGAKALTMDHVVPIARGGSSTKGNVIAACKDCNHVKKLQTPAEKPLSEVESLASKT